MTLTTRLSLFFLTSLALVLAGFSISLYWLARTHLLHQMEERATAVLGTLSAVVEPEPDGLEWNGGERQLAIGKEETGHPLVWAVFDEQGHRLDGSRDASTVAGPVDRLAEGPPDEEIAWQGGRWRVMRRTHRADAPSDRTKREDPGDPRHDGKRHQLLVLTVAVPLGPVLAQLRWLAFVLGGLSLLMWTASAVVGRWLCRRALAPVTAMARTAHSINAEDLSQRLPGAGTGDELDELGQAFNDLLCRIQVSFERQKRFTAEASHQLRTPLTGLLGQIEVALRRERPPEEYRRVLGSVRKQAGQLGQIVEMLLFLARADAEANLPRLERLDLGAWLTEHLRGWGEHPRHGTIQTERTGDGPLWVRVHPELLGQVLDNLLDNACKYSPPDSPILLQIWREGEEVCLAVTDRGYGISAEDLPHLFEPFFRSPDARQRGISGIGLGLAVTARIVSAFGGKIAVESQPGKGSRFVVRLPLSAEESQEEALLQTCGSGFRS
jgi:heavy metal sensor kinase